MKIYNSIFFVLLCLTLFCGQIFAQGESSQTTGFADNKSLKIEIPKGWKTVTSETNKALIVTLTPEVSQDFRLQITAIPLANLKPDANKPEQLKALTEQMSQSMLGAGASEEKAVEIKETKTDHGTAYYFHLTDKTLKPGQRKHLTQLILGIDGAVLFMTFSATEKDSAAEKKVFEMVKTMSLAKRS